MRGVLFNLRGTFDDIHLLFARLATPEQRARAMGRREAAARIDFELIHLSKFERLQIVEAIHPLSRFSVGERAENVILREIERGTVIALVRPRRRVVRPVERAAEVLGPDVMPPPGIIDRTWIRVELYDSAGKPMAGETCRIVYPDGRGYDVELDGQGAFEDLKVEITSKETFEVGFPMIDAPRPLAYKAAPFKDVEGSTLGFRRELKEQRTVSGGMAHQFQLAREQVKVIELEHFYPNGAVFLAGLSPSPIRAAASSIAGADALRAVFESASMPLLVTGHHEDGSLSQARADNVALLLKHERAAWAAHARMHATAEEEAYVRAWAASIHCPLEPGAIEWHDVFDRYTRSIAVREAPRAHKLIVTGNEPENIYPVRMAEITWGNHYAGRAQELEPYNGHLCRGPWQWKNPIVVGDEIHMPETWDPTKLRAAGFHVVPIDETVQPASVPVVLQKVTAIGCGGRHLATPLIDDEAQRGVQRAVEVIFAASDPVVCRHDGSCSTETCELYDPLVTELAYLPFFLDSNLVVISVEDQDTSEPIKGAVAELEGTLRQVTTTDEKGRVAYLELAPGPYVCIFSVDDFREAFAEFVVAPEVLPLDLTPKPAGKEIEEHRVEMQRAKKKPRRHPRPAPRVIPAPRPALPATTKRVEVELASQRLRAFDGTTKIFDFNCVTGDGEHKTDPGTFHIFKKRHPYRSMKYDAQMDHAMFFSIDGKAIHEGFGGPLVDVSSFVKSLGLDLLGSHGCVRLAANDATALYDWVPDPEKTGLRVPVLIK